MSRMNKFFHQRVFTPFAALLLAILCVGVTAVACLYPPETFHQPTPTIEQLYHAAVLDAMTIEPDEVRPLVVITPESKLVTWKDGKVLMLTVNRRPERYKAGETITLPGEVWTVTDKEMAEWFSLHKSGVSDWPLRLKQLIGVPPDGVYTHVTAMWVSPEDLTRPAHNVDITSSDMPTALPKDINKDYKTWFEGNIIWSYFSSAYPWTRLGYTYDWAPNSGEYGLSEFLVRPGAKVEVLYTDTIPAFIDRLEGK